MERRVGEYWEDIFIQNAWRGEVWELAERSPQSYHKTGEFGGAGGGGGGESSLGGIGGDGGIWFRSRRVRGGRFINSLGGGSGGILCVAVGLVVGGGDGKGRHDIERKGGWEEVARVIQRAKKILVY